MKLFAYILISSALAYCSLAQSTNWGDRQLEKITQREQALFQDAPNASDTAARSEWERQVRALITDYQNFLIANPESLEGTILYGKLLRRTGDSRLAYAVFTQANAIDPTVAVVKQEIGNCLAELGEGPLALWAFMEAIELSPRTALYHYQLGELIDLYETELLLSNIGHGLSLDRQKIAAFREAKQLDPQNKDFAWRYAQAFHDTLIPNAKDAFLAWKDLENAASTPSEKDAIALHQAHWLLELKENEQAQQQLATIQTPSLQATRNQLWRQIHLI